MTVDRNKIILENMARLAVLRDLAMADADEEPFFDNLTQLASKVIDAPVSLVSMVAAHYQFFKSSTGLPEPWRSDRRTPLSHSFCQHVVTSGQPLIITDAREHPLVKHNLAIPDLNVIGYLGMPLRTSSGHELGSFCVIDGKPREWTQEEIDIVAAFADLINKEIDARSVAKAENRLDAHIAHTHAALNRILEKANNDNLANNEVLAMLEQLGNTLQSAQ